MGVALGRPICICECRLYVGKAAFIVMGAAAALEPALNSLGVWAQQNIAAEIALCDTDVSALM